MTERPADVSAMANSLIEWAGKHQGEPWAEDILKNIPCWPDVKIIYWHARIFPSPPPTP